MTMKVPATSGRTANWPSVAKKSPKGTSAKKSSTGRMSATMIPTVIATDRNAESIRMPRMTVSAGRALRLRSGTADRPVLADGPAGC